MVTENDIGKIAYNFSWYDGSIEKGVLGCSQIGRLKQFFIEYKEKNGLMNIQLVFNNNTFVKKREFMSFLRKYSHFDEKTKSEFVYFCSHRIMLKDLFRKIKDL